MGVQDLTVQMVVIVVIGVFFASFMDAIAGGGGIISVPTYLLAGLPMHFALGTNKFSSSIGTAFSTGRYIKNGYVDWKLGIPSIVLALIGSFFGTKLQLMISEVYLQYLLLIVLPVVAFVVLRQRQLPEERGDIEPKKQMAIVYLTALVVGAYDGFYGPGTGHVPAAHFLQSRQARRAHGGRQCQARESVFQYRLAPDQPVKRQGLPRPRPHRHGVEHFGPFHRRGTRHQKRLEDRKARYHHCPHPPGRKGRPGTDCGMIYHKTALPLVGADDSVGPLNVADLLKISENSQRADRVVRP